MSNINHKAQALIIAQNDYIDMLSTELKHAELDAQDAMGRAETSHARAAQLVEDVDRHYKRARELEDQVADLTSRVDTLKNHLGQATQDLGVHKEALAESEAGRHIIQNDAKRLERDLERAHIRQDQAEAVAEGYLADLEALRVEHEQAQRKLDQVAHVFDVFRASFESIHDERQAAEGDHVTLTGALESLANNMGAALGNIFSQEDTEQ